MRRREFIAATAAAAVVGAWLNCRPGAPKRKARRRVILIAVAGLDTTLMERFFREGGLPHLAAFAKQGTFAALEPAHPTEADVAWATFATGRRPDRHGVFGRFGRNPENHHVIEATSYYLPGRDIAGIPLTPPSYRTPYEGEPFWRQAAAAGISTVALWAPYDLSPQDVDAGKFLSGFGVPDAYLTPGTYHYFCTDKDFPQRDTPNGGRWRPIEIRKRKTRVLIDPPPYASGEPVEMVFEPESEITLRVSVAGVTGRVRLKTYSPYFNFPFKSGLWGKAGAVGRIFPVSVFPALRVYLTPLDIDAAAPAFKISAPASFAQEMARPERFATRGVPVDAGAFVDDVIGAGPFAAQYFLQMREKRNALFRVVTQYGPDLLICGEYGLDMLAHAFWRFYDDKHPYHDDEMFLTYADTLRGAYQELDNLVGRLTGLRAGEETAIIIVSPHGNRPFRRAFCLNRWLWEQGYLTLAPNAQPTGVASVTPETVISHGRYRPRVDWSKTSAYACGFGHIYLNLKGRERYGRLTRREAEELKAELARRLQGIRDGGVFPIAAVHDGEKLCGQRWSYRAPDLVVTFADGYRVSWETVTGGMAHTVCADNKTTWNGDHDGVASAGGLILTNVKLKSDCARIEDVAPTVLDLLGIASPGSDGRSLLVGI